MNDPSHTIREVMDEEQTGEYLGKPPGTLRQWKYLGQGPPFVHLGRSVRYLKPDVDEWLAENTTRPEALR
jgi:predicted DNA-binding transcriptional regulator AlpA